jgi:hypothetical protein
VKQTEHKAITISVLESNIFENRINEKETVTIEDVIKTKEINQRLAKNNPYCILISKGEFSIVPADVREFISSPVFAGATVAKALLTTSVADKIIGQFYIKINKPIIKTKLFTNKEKAIIWLKQQLDDKSISDMRKIAKQN